MFLKLNSNMKLVYQLKIDLEKDPNRMHLIQKVTTDPTKLNVGLKGTYGLFGSTEWWDNIQKGLIKTSVISGKIIRCYEAGQDRLGKVNSISIILDNSSIWDETIYTQCESDISLFKKGKEVSIFYAHDERKQKTINGDSTYSETVVEMAVSID